MANKLERIITGHVPVATLTSTYTIKNFARQSDQGLLIPWACNSLPPKRPRLRAPLSGNDRDDGGYVSQFDFKLMTFGMYDSWVDGYIASGMSYGNVTVMLYDESDTAVFLQCKIYKPLQLNKMAIGYTDVIWPLRFGTIIT